MAKSRKKQRKNKQRAQAKRRAKLGAESLTQESPVKGSSPPSQGKFAAQPVPPLPEGARTREAPKDLDPSPQPYVFLPHDVLFFRGGRPFAAGENSGAFGASIPWPSTLYGCLRTSLAQKNDYDFDYFKGLAKHDLERSAHSAFKALGTAAVPGDLEVRGPFLARRQRGKPWEFLFQAPSELRTLPAQAQGGPGTQPIVGSEWRPRLSRFMVGGGSHLDKISQLPLAPVLISSDGAPGYVTGDVLASFLAGGRWPKGEEPIPPEALFTTERRVGLARTNSQTVQPGRLCTTTFLRLRQSKTEVIGLAFFAQGSPVALPSQSPFGGERRMVDIQSPGTQEAPALPKMPPLPPGLDPRSTGFFVYLGTPCRWRRGWHPGWLDTDLRVTASAPSGFPLGAQLLGVSAGRGRVLSGWDMARGRPKQTTGAVPAGAIYHFAWPDSAQGKAQPLSTLWEGLNNIHGRAIGDGQGRQSPQNEARMGWGTALIGYWN